METQSNMLSIHQNQVALSEQLHYREMVRD